MSHVGFLSSFYWSVDDLQRCAHLCRAVEPWMDEDDNSSDKGKLCKEGISGSVLISFHGEVNWDSERSSNLPQVTQHKASETLFERRSVCLQLLCTFQSVASWHPRGRWWSKWCCRYKLVAAHRKDQARKETGEWRKQLGDWELESSKKYVQRCEGKGLHS